MKNFIPFKISRWMTIILLVFFSCMYPFVFISNETANVVFGLIGMAYYCFLYNLASHLYLAGAIKLKPIIIFWLAFFSALIPIVHLIVPIYLLKKSYKNIPESNK